MFSKRGASLPEASGPDDSPPSSLGRRMRGAESRESIHSRASTPSISERVGYVCIYILYFCIVVSICPYVTTLYSATIDLAK